MSKIIVLMGSVRKNGNTDLLTQAFIHGAEKENEIEEIRILNVEVNGCIGCNYCYDNEAHECCQKDDMQMIYEKLKTADILVIGTPVYFYGVSSQLKCLIDRLHNPVREEFKLKKLMLLSVAADQIPTVFDSIEMMYDSILNYFHLEDGGRVLVSGVSAKGDIHHNPGLDKAYELGLKTH